MKSLEDKLHYIFDRIECGKMVMNNMDAKVEVLTDEIAGLIETKATATDELRKHIDGGDEKVESEGEKNPLLKQGLDGYVGTVDSVVNLEGMQVGRMRNVQLELKSFHNCARRALQQLQRRAVRQRQRLHLRRPPKIHRRTSRRSRAACSRAS